MSVSTEQAAKILVHYIEVALHKAGASIDDEMRAELQEVVEAFRAADKAVNELHSQRQPPRRHFVSSFATHPE